MSSMSKNEFYLAFTLDVRENYYSKTHAAWDQIQDLQEKSFGI